MTQSRPTAAMAPRALRADAQRNRDTILLAARDTFEARVFSRRWTASPCGRALATPPCTGTSPGAGRSATRAQAACTRLRPEALAR